CRRCGPATGAPSWGGAGPATRTPGWGRLRAGAGWVRLDADFFNYYGRGLEQQRLSQGAGRVELARTLVLLERFLPPPPAVICDVGGGSGAYAAWLARRGYTVHLVDSVPLHVEQARAASAAQPLHPLASV